CADLKKVPTPGATSIEQVSRLLGCSPEKLIKTLIYVADGQPVAVLIRGDHEANENKIRRALGASSVELADEATILKVTGAPVGFAGPVGIKCRVIADHDIPSIVDGVTGANEADAHFTGVNVGRDYQLDTTYDLRNAIAGDPAPGGPGGGGGGGGKGTLELVHGIEVGHVFKLGTKYSDALGAMFLDEKEQRHPIVMGCYGIGVNRIIAALAETSYDENGLIWPLSVAPYSVLVIALNVDDPEVAAASDRIYNELTAAGVDVLYDDRPARPGFKFKDADLIGIPLRVVVGGKGLAEGIVEVKWRTEAGPRKVKTEEAVSTVRRLLEERRAEEAARVPE
ncbi:MAG TPA: YbaK/EbsC family protein, partial [Planctomycetaceae bacterium]|nr:YbaK/EbsC family protein [Planctomycetaceae bacterium]